MTQSPSKVHDRFFKNLMKDNRVAKEFFQTHLPQDLQAAIQWNSLKLEANDHVNRFGREAITDVVFSVLFEDKLAYLTLIVDHQSSPHPLMPFRSEHYRYGIIDNYIKEHPETKTVPLVIPIVLYHGPQPWVYEKENLHSYVDAPPALVEKYAFKPFIFVDLKKVEDAQLMQFLYAGVMQLSLKRIFEKNILPYLSDIMRLVRSLDQKNDWEIVESVLKYLINSGEVALDELLRIIQTELPLETGEKIMTVAEQLIAKGEQRGMQQGMRQGMHIKEVQIAQNLLSNGFDIETVSKNTGLDVELLKKLKEGIKH